MILTTWLQHATTLFTSLHHFYSLSNQYQPLSTIINCQLPLPTILLITIFIHPMICWNFSPPPALRTRPPLRLKPRPLNCTDLSIQMVIFQFANGLPKVIWEVWAIQKNLVSRCFNMFQCDNARILGHCLWVIWGSLQTPPQSSFGRWTDCEHISPKERGATYEQQNSWDLLWFLGGSYGFIMFKDPSPTIKFHP